MNERITVTLTKGQLEEILMVMSERLDKYDRSRVKDKFPEWRAYNLRIRNILVKALNQED